MGLFLNMIEHYVIKSKSQIISQKKVYTTDNMKIVIDVNFPGNTVDSIVRNCIKKLYKYLKKRSYRKVCALISN